MPGPPGMLWGRNRCLAQCLRLGSGPMLIKTGYEFVFDNARAHRDGLFAARAAGVGGQPAAAR